MCVTEGIKVEVCVGGGQECSSVCVTKGVKVEVCVGGGAGLLLCVHHQGRQSGGECRGAHQTGWSRENVKYPVVVCSKTVLGV